MTALLIAQTDSTGQKVTLIVFALVAVAAALALLTAWYWRVTDPALRNDEARGRGGRRRPKKAEPEPDPEPEPGGMARARSGRPDSSQPSTDETRLLKRSDILQPTEPQAEPDVIDLRAETAVAHSRSGGPADDNTGELDVGHVGQPLDQEDPKVSDSAVLDIDAVEALEESPAGAHDAGIDFDEWLALAEEES
ncbi:MAG: hypothetical protein ACN4GZ_10580 [Acidimicrobiales bacterium]